MITKPSSYQVSSEMRTFLSGIWLKYFIDETSEEKNQTKSGDSFDKLVKELASKTLDFAKVGF